MERVVGSQLKTGTIRFGLAASIALSCFLAPVGQVEAANQPLFSGVTAIEVQTQDAQPTLAFQSDLPFQYERHALNDNQVLLRLYNVQLASALLQPDGTLAMPANTIIQSAQLQPGAADHQDLLLTGPGLAQARLQIAGAVEVASRTKLISGAKNQPTVFFPEQSTPTAIVATSETAPAVVQPLVSPEAMVMLSAELPASKRIEPEEPLLKPMRQPPREEKPAVQAQAPISQSSVANMPVKPTWHRVEKPAENYSEAIVNLPGGVSNAMPAVGGVEMVAPPQAPEPPEDDYQMMMSLPRYMGGALPIRAVTIGADGQPVAIQPKGASMTTLQFDLSNQNGGYNTLFQADDTQNKVSRLMEDASGQYTKGQYQKALNTLRQALQLDPDNADLHAGIGEVALKLSKLSDAIHAYQQAYNLNPNQYDQRYAQLMIMAGDRDGAMQLLKARYEANANRPELAYILGTLHEEQGQSQQALYYLRQAARLHPASADIQYNLGLAYELQGDKEQAEAHYQKAVELNPAAADAKVALSRVRQ